MGHKALIASYLALLLAVIALIALSVYNYSTLQHANASALRKQVVTQTVNHHRTLIISCEEANERNAGALAEVESGARQALLSSPAERTIIRREAESKRNIINKLVPAHPDCLRYAFLREAGRKIPTS